MSYTTIPFKHSSGGSITMPTLKEARITGVQEHSISIPELDQNYAVTPSGSLWSAVSQQLAHYFQSAVAGSILLSVTPTILPNRGLPNAQVIASAISHHAANVPSLEQVLVKVADWGVETFIIVNNSTEEERFQLYGIEWQMMQEYPEIAFKFNVVDREDMLLDDIILMD